MTLLLLLAGCDLFTLPPDTYVGDLDGDGFDNRVDCNDMDRNVHPGADEECDGVDDDCDGTEDDAVDAYLWFRDADGDGWGDSAAAVRGCTQPLGYVGDGGDCDDADARWHPRAEESDCDDAADYNCDGSVAWQDLDLDGSPACEDCDDGDASVHPGATERCDGRDDDCDGRADDTLTLIWHPDADRDGWGDPADAIPSCSRPNGWVLDGTDCDDADAVVHPDAGEACDGVDNDCDGETDEEDWLGNTLWYPDADGDGYGDPSTHIATCTPPQGVTEDRTDCDDTDPTINPATRWYRDRDGDGHGYVSSRTQCSQPAGYVLPADDCDDYDSTVFPGAEERCDGEDDDCDGDTDEDDAVDAPSWYADLDGDGFGDPAGATPSCDQPAGLLASAEDCDDTDDAVHPGAPEADCADPVDYNCDGSVGLADADGDGFVACLDCDDAAADVSPAEDERCDGVDDDCDGETDEDASIDALTWYADVDGDTFGDAAAPHVACEVPAGHVADATDCDDADDAVSPRAAETCATAGDDDCDGVTNEARALACTTFYVDADGDGYGDASACQCEADATYTITTGGDCDDVDPAVSPGATEVCADGVDQDCADSAECGFDGDVALDDLTRINGLEANDELGEGLAGVGDIDGDGIDDVLVGATLADGAAGDEGAAYLFCGPVAGTLDPDDACATFPGEAVSDGAGRRVAPGGDIDGDGARDLLVAAYGADGGAVGSGVVYVLYGPFSGSHALADAASLLGVSASDYAGQAVAGGADVDGDGLDDVLVGAPDEDTRGTSAGAAWLVAGPVVGDVSLSAATATLLGVYTGDDAGRSVAFLPDTDGDGLAEVAVGAPNTDGSGAAQGAVWVFTGPVSGTFVLSDGHASVSGAANYDLAGHAIAGGDADGDGYGDLLVGIPYRDTPSNAGGAVLVHGPLPASTDVDAADARISGETTGDNAGTAVALADLDGDGACEIVIGGDAGALGGNGGAWVLDGSVSGALDLGDAEARVYSAAYSGSIGLTLAPAGDPDADGYGDLLVGGSGVTVGLPNQGAAWLIPGGPGE